MRFKRGSIVEVLMKDESPSGSWSLAEVVSKKGHDYTVLFKFGTCLSDKAMVDIFSKKTIRPSPPEVELPGNWVKGDVLEVFQNFSWKMATVCKVLGTNDFLVRLVGFSHEFKVCRSDLRVRQSWQDGKWFVIGKNIGNVGERKRSRRRSLRNQNRQISSQITRAERKISPYNSLCVDENQLKLPIIVQNNRKRGISYAYSKDEVPAEPARKFKLIEKQGSCYRLPQKVVTHHLNNRKNQFTNLVMEREYLDGAVGRSWEINQNDEDITCSVGSCSMTSNDLFKSRPCYYKGPINDDCSDAESVCYGNFDKEHIRSTQKLEFVNEIRRLELNAYRCTMEALHACGPLSWEQETMVTNLRLSLNISNDEHLMELRNLASTATSLSFR